MDLILLTAELEQVGSLALAAMLFEKDLPL